MKRLLCVGDGPRDERPLPALLENLLGGPLDCTYEDWHDLRRRPRRRGRLGEGSGFGRKVERALLRVRRDGFDGLVAVLDRDTAPAGDRLAQARRGLDHDRSKPERVPVPTALGEAAPHFEAWLLDDGEAVKLVLNVEAGEAVPHPGNCANPKETLERLIADRGLDRDPTKTAVARQLRPDCCRRASTTGFQAFLAELAAEFSPDAGNGD